MTDKHEGFTTTRAEWQDAWERAQQNADRYSEALTIAERALEAIASPDCMYRHAEDGGWIDTEAPARIAEGALGDVRKTLGSSLGTQRLP
jgi:hypothetical protein